MQEKKKACMGVVYQKIGKSYEVDSNKVMEWTPDCTHANQQNHLCFALFGKQIIWLPTGGLDEILWNPNLERLLL